MYRLLSLILLCMMFTQLDASIDSLESELKVAKEDTNKVKILNSLAFELKSSEPQRGVTIALIGLELAKKIKWEKGEANSYFNLGLLYDYLSDYLESQKYYNLSLKIRKQINDMRGVSHCYRNIGLLYLYANKYDKVLYYNEKSLKVSESINDEIGIANSLENIGKVYLRKNEFERALFYYKKSLKMGEELEDKALIANSSSDMGLIFKSLGEYDNSLTYLKRALTLYNEINLKIGIIRAKRRLGSLYLDAHFNKKNMNQSKISSIDPVKLFNLGIKELEEAKSMLVDLGELHMRARTVKSLSDYYERKGEFEKAYLYFKDYKFLIDSVFSQDKAREIQKLENERINIEKDKKIALLNEREKASARESKIIIFTTIIIFLLILVVLFVIYMQTKKSEKLLLNILPLTIANRLKKKENPIADHFDDASIVFIDIVGFTTLASDAKAERIVEVLDNIFSQFDEIADKHNLEKIKTIGDSYMAVAGVPLKDPNHAANMANFALDVKETMTNYKTEDDTLIQFRIGIASGDVVAGVIGTNKFIYDLWGDTVNTASRMESSGTPGKIHVTEKFKVILDNDYQFVAREEIDIKGKGVMRTYYLESKEV